jgi:hypothetical protein
MIRTDFNAARSTHEQSQEQARQPARVFIRRQGKEVKVRPGTIRSGYNQQDSVMPWRGYILWIGGALLLLLLALDGLMPRTAFSHAARAEVRFPPIRIHSDVKGPEAVVIDTSQAVLDAIPNQEAAAAEIVTPSGPESIGPAEQSEVLSALQGAGADHGTSPPRPAREAFAQLEQPDQFAKSQPARPVSATRRHAQRRVEPSRQHAHRFRDLACDRCGSSSPGQAF